MDTKKIVVFTGLKGVGKDETAKVLIKYFGYKKVAFADLLKDITAELFGWPREGLEGITPYWRDWREKIDEHYGFSPRQALQKLGTELLRNQMYGDIWVEGLLRKIEKSKHKKFVITDCRFPNEISALKQSGYDVHFWRVERGERPSWWNIAVFMNRLNYIYKMKTYWNKPLVHSSERGWQGIDSPEVIVYNSGTLFGLKLKALRYAHKFLGENVWMRIFTTFKFYQTLQFLRGK